MEREPEQAEAISLYSPTVLGLMGTSQPLQVLMSTQVSMDMSAVVATLKEPVDDLSRLLVAIPSILSLSVSKRVRRRIIRGQVLNTLRSASAETSREQGLFLHQLETAARFARITRLNTVVETRD